MSTTTDPVVVPPVVSESGAPSSDAGGTRRRLVALARWVGAIVIAVVVFGVLVATRGANPFSVFSDAISSTLFNATSVQEIVIKAGPMALAALAVVIPARAGLVNVGGEGQLLVGAVAAGGTALLLDRSAPGVVVMIAMGVAGALAGAVWAGLAGLLRLTAGVNEAVTTLLLNYVALDLLLFLIYQPWRDTAGSGQPTTRPLADGAKLPVLTGTSIHVGIGLVLLAALATWVLLNRTVWGFTLSTIGGNPEAARRAGIPVPRMMLTSLLYGGGLAGIGGMIHFAGVEYQLRPGILVMIGYSGFLASWLGRHRVLPVLIASLVLSALIVSGDSLQLDSDLPAATANVLTGLVLVAVLGWTGSRPWIRNRKKATS
ncbi:MAG TPA: ABC transporter permease [Pseudonocardia sp.]